MKGNLQMTDQKHETIELTELRRMANKKGKLRLAAQRALTQAEQLIKQQRLDSIKVDNQSRNIYVYAEGGQLHYVAGDPHHAHA
jgi:hypothetical protein